MVATPRRLRRELLARLALALGLVLGPSGCGTSSGGEADADTDVDADADIDADTDTDMDADTDTDPDPTCPTEGEVACHRDAIQQCVDGRWAMVEDCPAHGAVCRDPPMLELQCCHAHAYHRCRDGDLYWFDACEYQGALAAECPETNGGCRDLSLALGECFCKGNRDLATGCTECRNHWDPAEACGACLEGWAGRDCDVRECDRVPAGYPCRPYGHAVGDTIHDLFLYSPRRDRIVRLSDYVTDVESRRASRVFWLISGAEWCSVTRITVQEAYALWLELRDRGVELLLSLNQDRDYGVTAEAIVAGAQRWDRDVLGDSLEDPDFLGVLADTSRLLDAYYTIAATPLNLIVGPDFTLHYAVVGWEGTEAMRATLEAIIEAEL